MVISMNVEKNTIRFSTLSCSELTDEMIAECKRLFDENYGTWDAASDKRPGEPIRFPTRNYEEYRKMPGSYVALAKDGDKIVGQAFYLRKEFKQYGMLSWVLQLVVHREYRRRKIAKTLLLSIWGFSSDYMWGLATSNALTIKTLESATFRKVYPAYMSKQIAPILMLKDCVPFAKDAEIEITDNLAIIDSKYPVDRETISNNRDKYTQEWALGDLKLGQEWLAFTFRDQPFEEIDWERFQDYIKMSDQIVQDAYDRMPMDRQPWARHAPKEIQDLLSLISIDSGRAYDIGCGTGRHAIELAKMGFRVTGFDYAKKQLNKARIESIGLSNINFEFTDCRELGELKEKADLILCLYDVIGTFVNPADNERIVHNIAINLKPGGYAAVSVMNYELTYHIATHKVNDIRKNLSTLLQLKASDIMQRTGNIFKPEYLVVDTSSGIVYHKEQFQHDGSLSAEYVIRDKRYTMNEISEMLERQGLNIVDARYVQAGRWDQALQSTDIKSKEILLIARKN